MADNTALWDRLKKTDPKHTKGFKRGGGFSGTAIKPMWVWQRLTEEFGPFGSGWGCGEPSFQVVPGDNRETLVYCTISAWHGEPGNIIWGVGGDKVVTHIKANEQYNRPERWENDDEAFKKAFTDALMNAFKFIGVGADVHMGLFDDNKYVAGLRQEFAEKPADQPKPDKQEDTHGPDWPNLKNPSNITSNAAKKEQRLIDDSKDVKSRLNFASTMPEWEKLVAEVTPIVEQLPQTWRRVLWGEYDAVRQELLEAA